MLDDNTQMLCSHDKSQSEDKMSQTNRPEKQWWPQLWAWQLTVGSNCFQNMEVPQKIIDLQNDLQNNDEDTNLKELDEEIKKQKLHQVKFESLSR